MDPVSGVLSTLQTLDRDNGITSYTIIVKAQDGGATQRSATATVTVTLSDENDNNPVFTQSSYFSTMSETSAISGANVVLVCI